MCWEHALSPSFMSRPQGACEFYLKVHKSKHITLPYQFDIHERNFNHEVKRHGTYNEIGFIKRKLDKMPHGLQQGKVWVVRKTYVFTWSILKKIVNKWRALDNEFANQMVPKNYNAWATIEHGFPIWFTFSSKRHGEPLMCYFLTSSS